MPKRQSTQHGREPKREGESPRGPDSVLHAVPWTRRPHGTQPWDKRMPPRKSAWVLRCFTREDIANETQEHVARLTSCIGLCRRT